jgi:peptidoglycan hydrolase-like protein with peptidoglycan-binding domain
MGFTPRLTRPKSGNKYYIRKANGGYSNAVAGNPTDSQCNVLHNCVGYAYGRFNEIGNYGYCKYLAPVNAENFIQYKGSCEVGQTPRVGACMVWQKGSTLDGSDGAGHVAIVEKVISDTEVVTSESGWKSAQPFWTQTRKKGSNGRWGASSAYKFLGFIYNPAVKETNTIVSEKLTGYKLEEFVRDIQSATGSKVDGIAGPETLSNTLTISAILNRKHPAVYYIQRRLKALGYNEVGKIDGVAGGKFTTAVKRFQKDNGCVDDGEITAREKTWKKLLGMV